MLNWEVKISYEDAVAFFLEGAQGDFFNFDKKKSEVWSEEFESYSRHLRNRLWTLRFLPQAAAGMAMRGFCLRLSELNWILQNFEEVATSRAFYCPKQKTWREIHLSLEGWGAFYALLFKHVQFSEFSRKEMLNFCKKHFFDLRIAIGAEHKTGAHAFRHWGISDLINQTSVNSFYVAQSLKWKNAELVTTYSSMLRNFNLVQHLVVSKQIEDEGF